MQVIDIGHTAVHPIPLAPPGTATPEGQLQQEGKANREDPAAAPAATVTLQVAPWRSQLKPATAGIAWAQSVETHTAMMAVVTGTRRVDVKMVRDVRWLWSFVCLFGVLSGERSLGCPCGGVLQKYFRSATLLFALLNLVVLVDSVVSGGA